jgi:hypothetical protein
MKKIGIIITILVLFAGISFAASFQVKPADKTKTEKKPEKKTDKKEVKKVPARKTVTKPKTAAPAAGKTN